MAALSDPAASWAILIGVGEYTVLDDLPSVGNNLTALKEALTSPAIWGLPEDHCTALYQPASAQVVLDSVQQAADNAADTLLVYFAGHGLIDPENDDELLLALPGSDLQRAYRTAVPYGWLRRELRLARARRKVVILDCCYSGRALNWMGQDHDELASRAEIEGTCVLTATARTRKALAPLDEPLTAFTSELVATLVGGIAQGPRFLDMDTIYQRLVAGLRARNMPAPQRGHLNNGGSIAIAVNRAFTAADGEFRSGMYGGRGHHAEDSLSPRFLAARGVAAASQLVGRTLGPGGRTCILRDGNGRYIEAADAETVAQHFIPEDPRDGLGASYVRDIVRDQYHSVQDGAATAVVLGNAMVRRVIDALDKQANPIHLKRGIDAAAHMVLAELESLTRDIESEEELAAVMSTAVEDPVLGKMLADAFSKVGKYGVIKLELSDSPGLELELSDGMSVDSGYASREFATDFDRGEAVLEDPYILMIDSAVSGSTDLAPAIDIAIASGRPLAVLASGGVIGDALQALVKTRVEGSCQVVAVQVPGDENHRRAVLGDIAVLTGGRVIDAPSVHKLSSASPDTLGRAAKVMATRDRTVIVDGVGDADAIKARADQIQEQIRDTRSEDDRERLRMRSAKLVAAIAVARVGGASASEALRRMKKAKLAKKIGYLSIECGIAAGGGIALFDAQRHITARSPSIPGLRTADEETGATIVLQSLTEPLKQIAENSGYGGLVAESSLMSWKNKDGIALDAATGEIVMMLPSVADIPFVIETALINAVALAVRVLLLG